MAYFGHIRWKTSENCRYEGKSVTQASVVFRHTHVAADHAACRNLAHTWPTGFRFWGRIVAFYNNNLRGTR